VGDDEFGAANQRIADAEADHGTAAALVERWREVEFQAKRFGEMRQRADETRERAKRARGLIVGADAIERDAARYRELSAVVPRAVEVIKLKGQLSEVEREAAELRSHALTVGEKLLECQSATDQGIQKRLTLQADQARDERRLRDLAERLQR